MGLEPLVGSLPPSETASYRFELLAVPLAAGLATGGPAGPENARCSAFSMRLADDIPAILLPGLVMS